MSHFTRKPSRKKRNVARFLTQQLVAALVLTPFVWLMLCAFFDVNPF